MSYTRFCAHKIILGARLCIWEIVHLKEKTCTLLITWYGGRKCTKLVSKPLIAKNCLSISVLLLLLSCTLYLFSLHDDYPPLKYNSQSVSIAVLQKIFPINRRNPVLLGETQIYWLQPKVMAATQEVRPKPRTVRDTKFYRLKPCLNCISKNITSATYFLMINLLINLYRLIKSK